MNTIIVDDDLCSLNRFRMECSNIEEINLAGEFSDPDKALAFVSDKDNHIETAFISLEMHSMNGMDLAAKLNLHVPGIVIIYLLSSQQHLLIDAFRDSIADYFLFKDYTTEDLRAAAVRAKLLCARQKKRIYIETFGLFNIYVDGKFILFTSRIAKEIMALLVNKRGTALSNKEAFYTIWEDAPYSHEKSSGYRKALRKLYDTLDSAGIADILISSGKERKLDLTKFDCDFYDFLAGDKAAIDKFNGEYMLDYSWGEETAANLAYIKQTGDFSLTKQIIKPGMAGK